jgi:hypothetical protein
MGDLNKQQPEGLVPVTSLQEFFMDSIDAAMATNKVVVDDHTAHYVVNLLTLFSRSEALYEKTEEGRRLQPLALMLANAREASSEVERNAALQRLGDVALFIAGFFADGLQRAAVDVDYYVYMGGGAYHSLSLHMRGTTRGRALVGVFEELGYKFQPMVDVLNEVRESARSANDADVLRLYDLWLKTGSARAERLLRELGIQPTEQAHSIYEH